ncbi:MAG: YbhB/YbcL family Raf kinase inhibitor-like protein, partial [Myxococcota bacterium]
MRTPRGKAHGAALAVRYTVRMLLALLLACTGAPADDTTDTAAPADTAPAGDFAVSLPAATSSEGHPRAGECAWTLSVDYECENGNPEVRWADAPAGTVGYALVFDDPDAGGFDHWAIVNVPAAYDGIDADTSGQGLGDDLPGGAYELENGFGFTGYL